MRLLFMCLAALLALPSLARGQESEAPPAAESAPAEPQRVAIPRGSRPQGDNPRIGTAMPRAARPSEPRMVVPQPVAAAPGPAAREAAAQEQPAPAPEGERRAIPRGSRPQGDNPRVGTAVPRSAPPPRSGSGDRVTTNRGRTVVVPDRRRSVIVGRPNVYNYYYPRSYYPYGYGAFGLGYFYYNPYRWYGGFGTPGYTSYGYYDDYYRRPFSAFDIGELRLDVSPRHAQVYVDGYYAGVVDDYDGAFQALKLESGAYRIEITAPGYESLAFDVRLTAGQKIRYQGDLRRAP